jgi:hypothetical protein
MKKNDYDFFFHILLEILEARIQGHHHMGYTIFLDGKIFSPSVLPHVIFLVRIIVLIYLATVKEKARTIAA